VTPDQIADLALRAGRDMRRVERVRALLHLWYSNERGYFAAGGTELYESTRVLADQLREALEAGHLDHVDAKMEVATSRANDSPPAPSATAKQPDRTTPW